MLREKEYMKVYIFQFVISKALKYDISFMSSISIILFPLLPVLKTVSVVLE